ncbi:MAG: acyl carrier protein [Marinilabiliaceae bacterium]|nr:acyl carrier protein [Marinilabiliaceae bacterium]
MEELKEQLKAQLIEQLNLEDITPDEIDSSEPLFGDGLGLDSIDALEIIVLLEKEYGIKLEDPKKGKDVFQSIDSLAAYITKHRQ